MSKQTVKNRKKRGSLRAKKRSAPSIPATLTPAFEPTDPRKWYEAGLVDGRAEVRNEREAQSPVLCTACHWFTLQAGSSAKFGWCRHPALKKTHPVTGEPEEYYAIVARGFYREETKCGPAAAWFEPVPARPPLEPEQEGLAEALPERSEAPLTFLQHIKQIVWPAWEYRQEKR